MLVRGIGEREGDELRRELYYYPDFMGYICNKSKEVVEWRNGRWNRFEKNEI